MFINKSIFLRLAVFYFFGIIFIESGIAAASPPIIPENSEEIINQLDNLRGIWEGVTPETNDLCRLYVGSKIRIDRIDDLNNPGYSYEWRPEELVGDEYLLGASVQILNPRSGNTWMYARPVKFVPQISQGRSTLRVHERGSPWWERPIIPYSEREFLDITVSQGFPVMARYFYDFFVFGVSSNKSDRKCVNLKKVDFTSGETPGN